MATWGRNKKTTIQTICGTEGCGNPLAGSTYKSLENGRWVLVCPDCAAYLEDVVAVEAREAAEWEARHPGRSNDPRDEYVGRVPDSWLRDD